MITGIMLQAKSVPVKGGYYLKFQYNCSFSFISLQFIIEKDGRVMKFKLNIDCKLKKSLINVG